MVREFPLIPDQLLVHAVNRHIKGDFERAYRFRNSDFLFYYFSFDAICICLSVMVLIVMFLTR